MTREDHWNATHAARDTSALTWSEETPEASIRLARGILPRRGKVVDIGKGPSALADACVDAGIGPAPAPSRAVRPSVKG